MLHDDHMRYGIGTRAIHAGQKRDEHGSVIPAIYQSSTFAFENTAAGAARFTGEHPGFIYTRMGNPTIRMLEDNVAALEGGAKGMACATGMAALNTLFFGMLNAGEHLVASESIYAPTRLVHEKHWSRFGVEHDFVDTANLDLVRAALRENTKLLVVESPANPNLRISDIAACAQIAHEHGALLAVDNTFMSPVLQRPLELGADIVMHSVTKFLNGHSDVVGGMLVFADAAVHERLRPAWFTLGGTMDPHQSWLVLRGIKTLKLRVLAAQDNAVVLADMLDKHPAVQRVYYPGLASHEQHEVHARQAQGPGSLISFELKGGLDAGAALMNNLRVMTLAVSLGGVETLIQHPASMTHVGMSREDRASAGISDGLVRLSVGCEDLGDLIADMEQALAKV